MTWTLMPISNLSAQNLATLVDEMRTRIEDVYEKNDKIKDSWETSELWDQWHSEFDNNQQVAIYAELIIDMRHALYDINNDFTFYSPIITIPSLTWVYNSRSTNTSYPFYITQNSNINQCTKIEARIFTDLMSKIELLENV